MKPVAMFFDGVLASAYAIILSAFTPSQPMYVYGIVICTLGLVLHGAQFYRHYEGKTP